MSDNPLKIISTQDSQPALPRSSRQSARIEMQAKLDRRWLLDPHQFDPMRNNIERERLKRLEKILPACSNSKKLAADLGCGFGFASRLLTKAGWTVHAVDISTQALKATAQRGGENITLLQDALPNTKLEDEQYELVVCTDVIGYLDQKDYRLLMAELARVVRRDCPVVCSTAIDIYSEDALQRFGSLAETEFLVDAWHFSHHALLLKFQRFFETPQNFIKSSKDGELRKKEMQKRSGFLQALYKANTSAFGAYFWQPFAWLISPFVHLLQQSRGVMLSLEKICRFFWSDTGISHVLFVGRRRPLIMPTQADLQSVEPKGKRQVWE